LASAISRTVYATRQALVDILKIPAMTLAYLFKVANYFQMEILGQMVTLGRVIE
jgi:hypothetical protein